MEYKYGQIYIDKENRFLEQKIYNYIDSLDYAMSYRLDKLENGDIVYIFTDLNEYNTVNYNDLIPLIVYWKVEHKTEQEYVLTQAKNILKYS